jgi:hypothetical protein
LGAAGNTNVPLIAVIEAVEFAVSAIYSNALPVATLSLRNDSGSTPDGLVRTAVAVSGLLALTASEPMTPPADTLSDCAGAVGTGVGAGVATGATGVDEPPPPPPHAASENATSATVRRVRRFKRTNDERKRMASRTGLVRRQPIPGVTSTPQAVKLIVVLNFPAREEYHPP